MKPSSFTPAAKAAADAFNGPGALNIESRYDAAGMGRRIRMWTPPSSGPNRAIDGLQKIRDRSRDSARNDWSGAASSLQWVSSLVGEGITPRWEEDYLNVLWAKSVKEIDADGVSDAYALQALGARTWKDGGEAFLRRRWRSVATSRLAVPVQVQLIEADYCPMFDASVWPGMPAENVIRQGIEINRYGERVAYWFYAEHPGDGVSNAPKYGQLIRVLARDVSHIFEPLRPGQMRGVPTAAPVLVKRRNAADLEDAVLDRQKLANLYVAFIKKPLPEDWDDITLDATTGLPQFWLDSKPIAALEPGIMQELQPGEEVQFANPPEAGTSYADFMRTTHMGTAAGEGLPYELLTGDLKDVSDRTLRIKLNEFRRRAGQIQWQLLIPKMCRPVVDWWAEAGVASGAIKLKDLEKAKNPEWTPQGWPDIHPTQDIEGRIKERDAGFTSTSAIIARKGEDPRKVLKQIQADKASGLTPPTEPEPKAKGASPITSEIVEMLRTRTSSRGGDASLQMLMQQVQTSMTAQAEMFSKTAASFVAALSAFAQQPVQVAAPAVSVTNLVEPARVEVNLPVRKTTTEIDHDREGRIVNVVQTERTVQ